MRLQLTLPLPLADWHHNVVRLSVRLSVTLCVVAKRLHYINGSAPFRLNPIRLILTLSLFLTLFITLFLTLSLTLNIR